ncbi:hypothetical protein NEFER03_1978 [Nematocida sp. LUAm3]|nr:hypothetical protein NEFER03_1978 [Nematocida sp. LUAm3]KAI5176062.1 hypothetical protein NEFER02_1896 [Nematocida sp. LUAm2]KAI5177106.1 hypothetical protein NEFER01_0381 [Nematocida sp. LUAm1]
MWTRREKIDESLKELRKSTSLLRNDPITRHPLMIRDLVERDTKRIEKEHVLDPITKPTTSLYLYRYKRERTEKNIPICLLCTEQISCSACICQKSSAETQDEYVLACSPEKKKQKILLEWSICMECIEGQVDIDLRETSTFLVLCFNSVERALLFYLAHREILFLRWSPERGYIPVEDIKAHSLRLCIIERAFSSIEEDASSWTHVDEGRATEKRDLLLKAEKQGFAGETKSTNNFVYQACGRHTNITLQANLRILPQEDLLEIVKNISTDSFFFLAKHKYGTYVIQLLISISNSEDLISTIKNLIRPYASDLLQHSIGNYVVQKMIVYDSYFVLECFFLQFNQVLMSKIGSRAFKNSLKYFLPFRNEILPKLQYVLEMDIPYNEQKILKTAVKELESSPIHLSSN